MARNGVRMQATIRLISTVIINSTELEVRNALRASTLALAGALFLTAAIPETGSSSYIILEDSHADMNLAEITSRFMVRLPKEQKSQAYSLAKLLQELSLRYQFSPGVLLSVIETESSFRAEIRSKAGAVGLMQLLPNTAMEVSKKYHIRYKSETDLQDPKTNMRLGVAYLSYLRGRFGSSYHYLAAYNLGPTALKTRISNGNYNLGAVEIYVRKIQERTLALREQSRSPASLSRDLLREEKLIANN